MSDQPTPTPTEALTIAVEVLSQLAEEEPGEYNGNCIQNRARIAFEMCNAVLDAHARRQKFIDAPPIHENTPEELRKMLRSLILDTTEADTAIKALCAPFGVKEADENGEYRDAVQCVEELVGKVQADKARLDFLQRQLYFFREQWEKTGKIDGFQWLRIEWGGCIQTHRLPMNARDRWADDECIFESLPEKPQPDIRKAIDEAMALAQPTKSAEGGAR